MPSPELTELRAQVRAGIEANLAFLDKTVKDIDAEIRRNIDSDTALKKQSGLLDSVPGLGVKTIPVLLSFFSCPPRFKNARQAGAYAGLDPRVSMNPAAASAESREFPRWARPSSARHFAYPR